ncbi:MAG: carboxypeptidase-like regulatory domain-containing protein [Isosphaeraceae bacterium]
MSSCPDPSRLFRMPISRLAIILLVGTSRAAASDPAGRVLDAAGKPVAGVTVSAIGRNWADPAVSDSAKTGPDGRFLLPGAWNLKDLDLRYISLFAKAEDGRCGWIGTLWKEHPSARDATIELVEGAEVAASLSDQDGKPVGNAPVILDILDRSDRENQVYDEVVLPRALAAPFETRTDAGGRLVLKGIPKGVKVRVLVDDPSVGRPQVYWDPAKISKLVLDRRLGKISGRLMPEGGKELQSGVKLGLRRMPAAAGVEVGNLDFTFTLNRSTQVGKDGRFQMAGLPPGAYFLDLEFDADAPYSSSFNKSVVLEPNKPFTPIEISLKRLPLVTGRVIDQVSGSGIEGVELTAYQLKGNSLQYGRRAKTDAAGKFRVAVEPGLTVIQPATPPKSHLGVYREDCPKLEVTGGRDWPDFKLGRATAIEGRVIDADGKPVPGAEVRLTKPDFGDFMGNERPQQAGPDGSFRLEQLDPTDKIPVRVRSADATSDGAVVIRPSDLNPPGKLTVTISPKSAARLTGRVVDQRGKPVEGAPVALWWNRLLVSEKAMKGMGLGSLLDQVKTGPDGRFQTAALWPGDRYHVAIDFKPYAKAETPEVPLSAGEVRDVGTIGLVESSAIVAGQVVDSDGKPIAGAEVFNRGDGPKPVSTRTGPDGRFRLEGLFAGSRFAFARRDGFRYGRLADALRIAQRKYLFVRKEGYRFGGMAVDGEPQDVTIRLVKEGESPAPWKPRPSSSFEEEKALAKRTLERLWEQSGKDAGKNEGWFLARQMAALDPELAMEWSSQHDHRYDDEVRRARAQTLAATAGPAAIRLLTEKPDNRLSYTLQELAERFVESDREKSALFAEEAVKQSRGFNETDRAAACARAGAVLIAAGRADSGRRLVEEAAGLAEKLPVDERAAYSRGIAARALALIEPKRAAALIEPIQKRQDRDRYTGFLIDAIGAADPDRALSLVETLDENTSAQQTLKTGIAFAVAPSQPDRAIRIVEGIKGYSPEKYQAEAFGWLAVAIASKDKVRAVGLIDRALALPLDKPEAFGSWTYFGGGLASAARIGLNARRIGYPDMEGVMLRVMAARPDGRHGFNDPAMQNQCQTIASPLVALLDPATAATILGQIEARSGLSSADLAGVVGEWWLAAWALADLKRAEALVENQLSTLGSAKEPESILRGLHRMIEVLLTPPDRREEMLRREIGASWRPGFTTSD